MPENDKVESFKYWRVFQLGLAAIFAASVGTIITILHNPEWHAQLQRLLGRAWAVFVAQDVGSTNRGFLNGLLEALSSILVVAVMTGYLHWFKEFKKHLMQTAIVALVAVPTVTLIVYGTQYAWEVAKAGYIDHQGLVSKVTM